MSLNSRAPEAVAVAPPAEPATRPHAPKRRLATNLRRSLTLRIALAIAAITLLLITASFWMVIYLLGQDFDEIEPLLASAGSMVHIPAEDLLARRHAFALRSWRAFALTLGVGALAASLFAWCTTRLILASANRLANTANRISAQALNERLAPEGNPAELEPVARAFNHMLDRLQNSFTQLSGFSSDIAHDLRAPIHRLLMNAQVTLARPRTADEYRAVIESTVPAYERMGRLIENILFLARTESQHRAIHASLIPLEERLEATAAFFELLAQERGLQLALQVEANAQVWADDTLLTRATANLLTNAIRHARPGSTVVLSGAVPSNGGCHIAVSNEGEPIAPEHQVKIFERAYRVEGPSKEETPGAGLGLAIVKSTMELHGGFVRVRSAPGHPTVFTLWFPPPPSPSPPRAPEAGPPRGRISR
ncbi:MAG: heavy metal sensor histidine kinase [Acidovorax sp.]|nr:heavy metal sensor histidine kinase [Acidovorax sp.]